MNLLEGLNDKQYEAVINTEGSCLVIAGAGSGKTKVLTHKIAYLIEEKNVKPWEILAITFTNKAANEMKERVGNLVSEAVKDIWMGTFHSVCVRILRKQIDRLGFDTSFVIFDTSDQKTLVKKIIKEKNLDDKLYSDKSIIYEISKAKNEMLEPDKYLAKVRGDFRKETIAEIYEIYQKRLKENNAIDFDDIINFTIKILIDNPDLLEYYSSKFKYILVDEYQDTNKSQFTLITLLASKYGNITVVGDNDQGIYSFRGADISNILNFERDFPGTKIIKLEQNYRCTQSILNVANEVIKNNETKYEKKLWTKNESGSLPQIYRADTAYDEANYIVRQIHTLKMEEYYKYSDFAVLYRMNTQSRVIEDALIREDIPYKIVGGLKFHERKEIKDIIAYLRLLQNTADNLSLIRIINEPKRGIGKTSLDNIENLSLNSGTPMFDIIENADKCGLNRIYANSREFINIIKELQSKVEKLKISELIKEVINKTGYLKALELENTVEAETRIQNIDEFITEAVEYEEESAEPSLRGFLEGITLSADIDNVEESDDTVTLMTLHSAKGLEFPVVFLVGLEEGVFPGYKSISDPQEIEEERRLCYVGITRAKNNLFLTCSKQRTIFNSTSYNAVSRFLKEIPSNMVEGFEQIENSSNNNYNEDFQDTDYQWKYGKKYDNSYGSYKSFDTDFDREYRNSAKEVYQDISIAGNNEQKFHFRSADSFLNNLNTKKDIDISIYKSGVKVNHKKFGQGIINYVEKEEDDLKVDINFEKFGHKRLMAKYAGLEVIE